MAKYLDETGVATLWSKMKSYVDNKTGSNVSLSSNNTWTGTNNFTGSLQKNGVNVATTSDIKTYTDLNQVDDKMKHIHAQGYASTTVWLRIIYLGTDGGKVNINGSLGTYETYGNAHVNMTLNARSGKQVLGTAQTENINTAFDRVDFGIDEEDYVWMKWNDWYNYDLIITCNNDSYFVDITTSSSAPSWTVSAGYTGTYSHLIIN